MFSRTLAALVCASSVALCSPSAPAAEKGADRATPDLSGFPKLTGHLVQLLGQEGGYVPPRPGEPFRLNLADLAQVKQLEFDFHRKSYIPLPGPLTVEAVRYYRNGAFQDMRLVSRGEGRARVTIDVLPLSGVSPNYVRVWVVVEREVVWGVALIDCQAGGKFPNRPK